MGCSSSKDADGSDSREESRNVELFLAPGVHRINEQTKLALAMSGFTIYDNGQPEAPPNSVPSAHQVQQPRRHQGQRQQVELRAHTPQPQGRQQELTEQQLRSFTAAQLRSLTKKQLRSLTAEQLRSFTAEQLRSLTAEQLRSFTVEQLPSFTAEQLRSFTAEQLLLFAAEQLRSLTAEQLRSLTAEQLRSFTAEQLSSLSRQDLGVLLETMVLRTQEILAEVGGWWNKKQTQPPELTSQQDARELALQQEYYGRLAQCRYVLYKMTLQRQYYEMLDQCRYVLHKMTPQHRNQVLSESEEIGLRDAIMLQSRILTTLLTKKAWDSSRTLTGTQQNRPQQPSQSSRVVQHRSQAQGSSRNAAPTVSASRTDAPQHVGASSRSGPSPTRSQVTASARQQAAPPRVQQPQPPQSTPQHHSQDQGPSRNAAPAVSASRTGAPRHVGVSSRSGPSPTRSQVTASARQQAASPRVQQPQPPQSTPQHRSQAQCSSGNAAPAVSASRTGAPRHVGVSSRSGPSPTRSQVTASARQPPAPPAHSRPTGSSTGTSSSNVTRTRAPSLRVDMRSGSPPAVDSRVSPIDGEDDCLIHPNYQPPSPDEPSPTESSRDWRDGVPERNAGRRGRGGR